MSGTLSRAPGVADGVSQSERRKGYLTPFLLLACAMIAGPLFLYYLALLAEAKVDLPRDIVAQLTHVILGGIAK